MHDSASYTIVASFTTVTEAEVCKGMLQANGVDASLRDAETVSMAIGYSYAVGGVKVVVPASQANEAAALIASTTEVLDYPVVCPRCGSTNVIQQPLNLWSAFLALLTANFSSGRMRHFCRNCDHQW